METDLQNLISEYCAIEKMDRLLLSTDRADETELIGLRVREMRRREILVELTTWIIAAEDFGEKHESRGTGECDTRTQWI